MKQFGTAVILAGGKSSRMGFDKQFIKSNEKLLMDKNIQKLSVEFDDIIVVSNKPELYHPNRYKVVCDIFKERGPLGGIHTGLQHASSQYVFFLACDMPYINLEYIRYLKRRISNLEVDACITELEKGIEPFNGFYSVNLKDGLEKHLINDQKASVYYYMKNLNCLYIKESEATKFCPNLNMFLNLNTKEELNVYYEENGTI